MVLVIAIDLSPTPARILRTTRREKIENADVLGAQLLGRRFKADEKILSGGQGLA